MPVSQRSRSSSARCVGLGDAAHRSRSDDGADRGRSCQPEVGGRSRTTSTSRSPRWGRRRPRRRSSSAPWAASVLRCTEVSERMSCRGLWPCGGFAPTRSKSLDRSLRFRHGKSSAVGLHRRMLLVPVKICGKRRQSVAHGDRVSASLVMIKTRSALPASSSLTT